MIAGFIYYAGAFNCCNGEIGINNFFSFLAAMMLSYQPVRSLATVNMSSLSRYSCCKRVFKIIDEEIKLKDEKNFQNLKLKIQI